MTSFFKQNQSCFYGPVQSWRFGKSLGLDLLFTSSICSFNCIYCQLGNIENNTSNYDNYVSLTKIREDLEELKKANIDFDVITISGNGEPTLALNLMESIDLLKQHFPNRPLYILTNGTELHNPAVIAALQKLDKVTVKVDAATRELFNTINRPVSERDFASHIKKLLMFKELLGKDFETQSMFMPLNQSDSHIKELGELLKKMGPSMIQLNTPKRPYPLSWHRENRGNHEQQFSYPVKTLKQISENRAREIEGMIFDMTKIPIQSIYHGKILSL